MEQITFKHVMLGIATLINVHRRGQQFSIAGIKSVDHTTNATISKAEVKHIFFAECFIEHQVVHRHLCKSIWLQCALLDAEAIRDVEFRILPAWTDNQHFVVIVKLVDQLLVELGSILLAVWRNVQPIIQLIFDAVLIREGTILDF